MSSWSWLPSDPEAVSGSSHSPLCPGSVTIKKRTEYLLISCNSCSYFRWAYYWAAHDLAVKRENWARAMRLAISAGMVRFEEFRSGRK